MSENDDWRNQREFTEPRGCPTPGACSCLHDAAAERAACLAMLRTELVGTPYAATREALRRIITAIEARHG